MAKKQEKKKSPRDLLFLACLFLGIGIGYVYGNVAAGALIGLGVGFLAAFLYTQQKKKR